MSLGASRNATHVGDSVLDLDSPGDERRRNCYSTTRNRPGCNVGKHFKDTGNQWGQVGDSVRPCTQDEHGNGELRQALLKHKAAVHGQQTVELVLGDRK